MLSRGGLDAGAGAGRADGAAGGKVAGSCPAGALVLGFAL